MLFPLCRVFQTYNQMMALEMFAFVLLALLHTVRTATFLRLETGGQLARGDELISTLGLFKVIMTDSDCSLNLYRFDRQSSTYVTAGLRFTGNYSGSCGHLRMVDQRILTDQGRTFLQLSSSNLSKIYLIIDDSAVLRLIGHKNPSGNAGPSDFEQIQYNNYTQTNAFVSVLASYNQISDRLTGTSNRNNWMFQLSSQTLTIINPVYQISQSFTIPTAFFAYNGIFDSSNNTFPVANFEGFLFGIACSGQKNSLDGPFVLEIDQFWPRIAVYDQTKTKVFEYSIMRPEAGSNPCPKFTFSLNNQCYTSCPNPYFHQVSGELGRCVLVCEHGSVVDQKARACKCPNRLGYINPAYNCINSTAYQFGCFCQNGTFFDRASFTCRPNCTAPLQPFLGMCLNCSRGCSQCSISPNGVYSLVCTQCLPNYSLINGLCIYSATCPSNCLTCNGSICLSCQPFFVLSNGICTASCSSGQVTMYANLTSICSTTQTSQAATKCGVDCLKCSSDSTCVICHPGYALLVTPIAITCRIKNIYFSCRSPLYSFSANSNVCFSNDSNSQSQLNSCIKSISGCILCHNKISNICLLCKEGLLLQDNQCVSKCSNKYSAVNQGCVLAINQCQVTTFLQESYYQTIAQDTVINNQQYNAYINKGLEASNEPFGFGLYFSTLLDFINNNTTANARIPWMKQACSQCQNGYGLSADHSACLPCPQGCLLCLYSSQCITSIKQQMLSLTFGSTFAQCGTFLGADDSCLLSCPSNTVPIFNKTTEKMGCIDAQQSSNPGYLKIDGSTYVASKGKYIHRFVFDSPVTIKSARMLQTSNLTIDASGNSITFSSNSPTQILNLTGSLPSLSSSSGKYPANSVYGINYQTSFRNYITKWLAGIGYVLSIILILIHCVYIANDTLYKMDNILITAQSLYFFLFNHQLIANPVAQFYYGFSWAHLNFFPNYFQPQLDITEPTVLPYALYNLDANTVRNAGSTLSLLLTFALIWGVGSLGVYLLDTVYGRKELWYQRISRNSIIAALEFLSYNIFYWCVAFINYDMNYSNSGTFIGLSVLLLTILIVYTIGRLYFNLIGGIYMLKRLFYACVLASSYQHPGYLGLILAIEVIFGACRALIQKPREKWMLVSLWLQEGAIMIMLIILYTTTNASVVSIIITIFIYAWLLTFVADLADLYFLSKNKRLELSCFRKLFEEQPLQACKSNESEEKGDTDRPIMSSDLKN